MSYKAKLNLTIPTKMKIDITKKHIILVFAILISIAISVTLGYFWGFSSGVKSTENPKGDGLHFFMECFDSEQHGSTSNNADLLLYHSTLDCPNIRYGTERDGYGYYKTYNNRKVPYIFCPKCMDNSLIDICEDRILAAYPETVKNNN